MEKTELLARPFCGNSAIVVEICGGHFYKVKCRNIMACGAETERFDDEEEAVSAWNRRTPTPDNKPLTVEELREMAHKDGCVWCSDGRCVSPGLLCLRNRWDDCAKEPHIWLLNEEGEPGVYDVEYMMKSGAKFYRRPHRQCD